MKQSNCFTIGLDPCVKGLYNPVYDSGDRAACPSGSFLVLHLTKPARAPLSSEFT